MKFKINCVILIKLLKNRTKNLGVAQMVARYLGVVEAAGSNPVTQTNRISLARDREAYFGILLRNQYEPK